MSNLSVDIFNIPLDWKKGHDDENYSYHTELDGNRLKVKINSNFPEEDLYTLIIDENTTIAFNDWPEVWDR